MRMCRMRKTACLGIVLTLVILTIYHRYTSVNPVISKGLKEESSISSQFKNAIQQFSAEERPATTFQEESESGPPEVTNENPLNGSLNPDQSNHLANSSTAINIVVEDGLPLSDHHTKVEPDNYLARCSISKGIHHNGADLQVSDLVENLPFQSENTDHGQYNGNLKPLPTSEELTVFLVPHSHCDPGWKETYDHYYERDVKPLLTNMYQFTLEHEDFKYIYAEVSFFKLWWEEQTDKVRQDMARLAREGRFEFVQGGWVMNDEANTHYFAILNQMMDGHEWLKKNLPDAVPNVGWAIDPFGLSPFMAQVNSMFGFNAMHIQRVHYTIKKHLALNRKIEFRWRQSWDPDGDTDILTQLGPFGGYNSQSTCGPDPDICLHYHFAAFTNPKFGKDPNLVKTTPSNVKERSLKILDQWRKKAALHSSNAVFIETGFDFSYIYKESLEVIYSNYKPMMEYINSHPELNTRVKWGTISDYFDKIKKSNVNFPSLSGDFFTYADRLDEYWSGYYTTRPFFKNLDRVLESSIRRTEILFSFHREKGDVEKLTKARNTLSLFQHHDAITGTAKHHVVLDYARMLLNAFKTCIELSTSAVQHILETKGTIGEQFQPIRQRAGYEDLEKFRVLEAPVGLVITSTIPRKTDSAQIIAVKSHLNLEVESTGGGVVLQQIEPAIEYGTLDPNSEFIVFRTELPSVSINKFEVTSSEKDKEKDRANVQFYNPGEKAAEISSRDSFTVLSHDSACDDISLGGDRLALILDCRSGRVKRIKKEGTSVEIEQQVLLYKGRSGAYLFRPSGSPTLLFTESSRPEIVVIKGSLRDKAVVTLRILNSVLVLTYIVHHHPGLEGEFVDLNIMSNLRDSGDLSIRLKTDIKSGDTIFTDLNGHTIQQHKYKSKLHTQGNFFPMPSTAFIQDSSTRLSLLGSEPHGAASLAQGWIEVVIDRRTSQDDLRGLGEAIQDNIPTPAKLRILVEARSATPTISDLYVVEYPSLVSHWTLQSLLHPAFILSVNLDQRDPSASTLQLMKSLPCDEELVNLRYVNDTTSQLIRRKLGFSCAINTPVNCDYQDLSLEQLFAGNVVIVNHPFSALRTEEDTKTRDLKSMEFSSQYVTFDEKMSF